MRNAQNGEVLEKLNIEIELIEASLLPAESLVSSPCEALLRTIEIISTESTLRLLVHLLERYPEREAVQIEVKGDDVGREEAERWKIRVEEMKQDWDEHSDTPLYTIMTTHFLPLLAANQAPSTAFTESPAPAVDATPHHALIITHHLLSPTKRKLLVQLSSELNLSGFSKTGHPGVMYAIGEKEDIGEWLAQVRSWNWLALKLRIGCEPVPHDLLESGNGDSSGGNQDATQAQKTAGQKARGDWVELEKLAEALDWMKRRGREKLLVDAGVGSSSQ